MSAAHVIPPGAGTPLGMGMTRKLDRAATTGHLGAAEAWVPPGMFVPPHVHTREDEVTYVLEGTLHVVVDEALSICPAGTWILKPRDLVHAFWNAGPAPARVIELWTPATLDDYFGELAALVQDPALDEAARRASIDAHQARHGITFFEDRAADYARRFGAPARAR